MLKIHRCQKISNSIKQIKNVNLWPFLRQTQLSHTGRETRMYLTDSNIRKSQVI